MPKWINKLKIKLRSSIDRFAFEAILTLIGLSAASRGSKNPAFTMASYNELDFEWSILCGKDWKNWSHSGESFEWERLSRVLMQEAVV